MAYRLGDYVLYGELRNTSNYSTTGYLVMRSENEDDQHVLHLNLTGNPSPDLMGKRVRFWLEKDSHDAQLFRRDDHKELRDNQIGPTGTMTAEGWVKTFDCTMEEFLRRSKLGEPPPTRWTRKLHFEWHSQNGNVVVELADVLVEECIRPPRPKDENDDGDWVPLPNLAFPPELSNAPKAGGPGFRIVHIEGESAHVEDWTPPALESEEDFEEDESRAGNVADAIKDMLGSDEEDDDEEDHEDDVAEMELMDYCIEHAEEIPIQSLIKNADNLPAPEDLDDEQVESKLKLILGELALIGITLDVCEHFTPRDCYRILLETVLPEGGAIEELIGTGWVQHTSTSDFCKACEAEFDSEYEGIDELLGEEGRN